VGPLFPSKIGTGLRDSQSMKNRPIAFVEKCETLGGDGVLQIIEQY
jgi:hypothetical protein